MCFFFACVILLFCCSSLSVFACELGGALWRMLLLLYLLCSLPLYMCVFVYEAIVLVYSVDMYIILVASSNKVLFLYVPLIEVMTATIGDPERV